MNTWCYFRVRLEPPEPKYWIQFPKELFGRGNTIRLGAHIIIRGEKYISVVPHLRDPEAKQRFDSLRLEEEPIEMESGARSVWRWDPGEKHSEILLKLPDVDPQNERDWPRQHDWFKEKLEAFDRAFAPRIRRL